MRRNIHESWAAWDGVREGVHGVRQSASIHRDAHLLQCGTKKDRKHDKDGIVLR